MRVMMTCSPAVVRNLLKIFFKMKRQKILFAIFFLFLVLISFVVKLIEFDNPYSGFALGRQLDNLVAMEEYFLEDVNLLKRRVLGGWPGYVLYGLPVYQSLGALLSPSYDEILFTARSINLVFALLSVVLLFKIASTWFGVKTAVYSSLFFTFAPLNLMHHRGVMMDVSSVFFCLVATWILVDYFENEKKLWKTLLFVIAGGLSVTTKPLYFFPVGAIALANYITQYRPPFFSNASNYMKKNLGLVIAFILITAIMLGWVWFVKMANASEARGGGVLMFLGNGHFLLSPKYYALLTFRFFLLILNPFTGFLFMIGAVLIWTRYRKKDAIALPFLIPLYYLFFADINSPHEYYSLIMIPYCSLVAGVGAVWIEERLSLDNLVRRRGLTQGVFCVFSSMISVLIFILNFLVGSLNLESKPVQIQREMHLVLEPKQAAHVYINKPNFPLHDYVKYNRSLYLSHVFNVRSEEDIRTFGEPITPWEILYALRQFGNVESTEGGIPKVVIDRLQSKYQGKLRYVLFYRYSEEQKPQINEKISEYQAIYESKDWVVYDLTKRRR